MSTEADQSKKTQSNSEVGISKEVIDELSNEINNMISFAVYNGITINTEINTLIQKSSVDDLINAHNLLTNNIAPATPKTIEYTKKLRVDDEKKPILSRIPLVRNLMLLAILFLAIYISTGLSPTVNNDSLDLGIMNNNGIPLLLNLAYLSAISGLGVLFYLLKKVSNSIKEGTLSPEEPISYMAQILLGIIAGLIISEIISFSGENYKDITLFHKSMLALIGGFSSDAIFSILQGIIDRIKSIFIISK